MAFFHNNFFHQGPSFTPLIRFVHELDQYSRQSYPQADRRCSLPRWEPRFDALETSDAYKLHGELPGVSKENVTIEFSKPQTLVVRGRREKSYTAGTPPTGQAEDTVMSGAIPDAEQQQPKSTRQATVEDEVDEGWTDASHSRPGTPDTTTAEVAKQPEPETEKPAETAKYWLAERSFGVFSRSFNFGDRIDPDGVKASFNDGVLTIVVPKAKTHESRRIAIN